jgi:hypothetical protein
MIPVIASLIPIIGSVLDKVIPNASEREKVKMEIQLKLAENETELVKLFAAQDQGQIEINKEEAKSNSLFIAGWRPAVGWICAFGCVWAFILKPILDWGVAAAGSTVALPVFQTGELMSLLLGLLGMGTLRTYEKFKGVAR